MDYRNAHKAHPWHGISLGKNVPEEVRAKDDAVESAALNMQYAICTQYAICRLTAVGESGLETC